MTLTSEVLAETLGARGYVFRERAPADDPAFQGMWQRKVDHLPISILLYVDRVCGREVADAVVQINQPLPDQQMFRAEVYAVSWEDLSASLNTIEQRLLSAWKAVNVT
jgi:hypothetical protein